MSMAILKAYAIWIATQKKKVPVNKALLNCG